MVFYGSLLPQKWGNLSQVIPGYSISPGIVEGVAFKQEYFNSYVGSVAHQKNILSVIFNKITSKILSNLNSPHIAIEHKDFINTQYVFFSDPKLKGRIFDKLDPSKSLQVAIQEVFRDLEKRFSKDAFWQSRVSEFQAMTLDLLHQEIADKNLQSPFELPTILVTRWINPDKLLSLAELNVKGLILVNSNELSHLAIFVKSLNIPVLGIPSEYEKNIQTGDPLLVNASEGSLHIHPESNLLSTLHSNTRNQTSISFSEKETVQSLDGISIKLSINVNIPNELKVLDQKAVTGIGLFRSEFPFMLKGKMLSLHEQVDLYKNVYNQAKEKPIYFRTLDVSGDKILPMFENNESTATTKKFNYWQSTRLAVDRPLILRHQIRALLKARVESDYPYEPVFIMFPMISDLEEFLNAKKLINAEEEYFRKFSQQHMPKIYVGTVVEVPSLVYQLEKILPFIDFATIGSNDLFHFFYATNRYDPHRKNQHDILSVSFLSYLKGINDLFKKHAVKLCLCGEMAGSPLEAMVLLSQGFRHFSISPVNLEKIFKMIQSCNIADLEEFYVSFQENASGAKAYTMNMRQHMTAYAKNNSILI